jgi:hypothetical protein
MFIFEPTGLWAAPTADYGLNPPEEQVARTADFAVRVFSVAIIPSVPYPIAVSDLQRPFLSDFFTVARLLRRREKFAERDFALLARAFSRACALHPFYPTAWVFLPDPSADGHCIDAPHFDPRARI